MLALNDEQVLQTSPMTAEQLGALQRLAAWCKVVDAEDRVAAFLIALREGAPYENDNYAWFSARFPRFLYVDRVVVGKVFAGRGLGSQLYAGLFAFARHSDVRTIACEYDIFPPNPASRAFHDKHGFVQRGTHWVANGTKQVSLQVAQI